MKRRMAGMLAAALLAQGALGQTWTNLSGGAFTTAGNWNPSTVPGPGNTANINQRGGPYTVFLDTAVTNATVNIGGTAGAAGLDTDITLNLSGGGSLATTAGFFASNSGGLPNRLAVQNGTLHLGYTGTNLRFAESASGNEFLFQGVAVNTYCPGTQYAVRFANLGGVGNRLEISGGSKWLTDAQNLSGEQGFTMGAGTGNAADNLLLVSGPGTEAVFSPNCRFSMDGEGNELRVENGALFVASNKLAVATGGARDNLVRVTGEGTRFVACGRGNAANGGGIDFGSYAAVGSSDNTFRADDGAHVLLGVSANNYLAVNLGAGGGSCRNTMQFDSGATLEMDGTFPHNILIGAQGNSTMETPDTHNAMVFDNAFFKGNRTTFHVGNNNHSHNSLIIRNGSVYTNFGGSMIIGGITSVSNHVVVADSSFYHEGGVIIGNGWSGGQGDTVFFGGGRLFISNSVAEVTGGIVFGQSALTGGNVLEIADKGSLTCNGISQNANAALRDNAIIVRDCSALTNLNTGTMILGKETTSNQTLTVTGGSVFFHNGPMIVGGGSGSGSDPIPGQARMTVNASVARIAGAVTVGRNQRSHGNLLEVANGGLLECGDIIQVGWTQNANHNTLRVTGQGSMVTNTANILLGGNSDGCVGNRLEILDGGELATGGSQIVIGNTGALDCVLKVDNGILRANTNLLVQVNANTNGRFEVAGAKSDIRIRQLTLNQGATLAFTIGKDGVAPIVCATRAINATARLEVSVIRHPGGVTLPLIVNSTPANGTTQQFAEGMYDIPEGCTLVQDSNGISIKIPVTGATLMMIR